MKTIGPHKVTADEVRRAFASMWVRIAAWDEERAYDFTDRFITGLYEYAKCKTLRDVAYTMQGTSFVSRIKLLREGNKLYADLVTGRWRKLP